MLNQIKKLWKSLRQFVNKHPLIFFFSFLVVLLLLIIGSNFLTTPKTQTKPAVLPAKPVQLFHIGSVPKITLQAQIEKSGVIQIVALTQGVVSNLYVKEGDSVNKGNWIASLSSNYQGGNAFSIARQIAEKQNQNVEDTYQEQKDLVNRQRDLTNQTKNNFEQLRDITARSVDDTKSLIDFNNGAISSLNDLINNSPASAAASLKPVVSSLMGANLSLNTASRSAQYQTNSDNPPTQLALIQQDIVLKQLDIQDKALDLNRDISRLQLQLARVNEAMMYPATPFAGMIQRIFVRVGQQVNSGTVLATVSSVDGNNNLKAVVQLSREVAQRVSRMEPSLMHLNNSTLSIFPYFISSEATQGSLYSVLYAIPEENNSYLTDKGFISIDIPIGLPDTSSADPYIPIDAIYQTENKAYVYLDKKGKAVSQEVELGAVYGQFIEVIKGLSDKDLVIVDRNIISGDLVTETTN
jgi:multidrug efflux pump subunit AcrA (membrane-fusion protein)